MFDWLFSKPLAAGSQAPEFALPDEAGNLVRLSDLRGKNVVLVFYPGDDTPVCTRQLCELRDRWADAQARNSAVFGVNPRGAGSHARFRGKHALPFPLLIDQGQKVARRYNASGLIVRRTVYGIGADGIIRFARRGKPAPDDIFAALS